jgi:hypothetical protein
MCGGLGGMYRRQSAPKVPSVRSGMRVRESDSTVRVDQQYVAYRVRKGLENIGTSVN